MAEHHNNSKPASGGTFSINRNGSYIYFPVEKADFLKPYMALMIHEHTDGSLTASIDMRFMGQIGEIDE